MTRSPLEGFIQCTSNLDPDSFIMLSFLSIDFASATGREEGREMEMNSADRASTRRERRGGIPGCDLPREDGDDGMDDRDGDMADE